MNAPSKETKNQQNDITSPTIICKNIELKTLDVNYIKGFTPMYKSPNRAVVCCAIALNPLSAGGCSVSSLCKSSSARHVLCLKTPNSRTRKCSVKTRLHNEHIRTHLLSDCIIAYDLLIFKKALLNYLFFIVNI